MNFLLKSLDLIDGRQIMSAKNSMLLRVEYVVI